MENEQRIIDNEQLEKKKELFDSLFNSVGKKALAVNSKQDIKKAEQKIKGHNLSASDFLYTEEAAPSTRKEVEYPDSSEKISINNISDYVWHEMLKNGREYFDDKRSITESELVLELLGSKRTDLTDKEKDHIDKTKEHLEEIENASPDGYYIVNGYDFRDHIRELKNRELVTTPYVKEHLDRLVKNMKEGKPTFVHGHLGSGKTELAVMAAKRSQIEKAALDKALESVEILESSFNDNMSKGEKNQARRKELARAYSNKVEEYQAALRNGDKEANDKFGVLLVSGSKDLMTQDLYVDKTLKLTKFNGKSIQEHLSDLNAEVEKWKADHPEEAKNPEVLARASDEILEIYKLKNEAFGTEVQEIEQALYKGIKEGRPVIIDEVNAIPASILISMNDILTKRPGDTCYVPGKGQTEIADGFSLTMTGNISNNDIDYAGTNDLNPAFLSRLDIFEHDYLPMSQTDPNYKEQFNPRSNELFYVAIAKLADQNGNLILPEMDKSLDKIFHLTQLARQTQLIFAGKMLESKLSTASGDDVDPELNEGVLSMRAILDILKKWQSTEYDGNHLDKALWKNFIDNIVDPEDRNIVIGLAKTQGFFQSKDGWDVEMRIRGAAPISFDEAHPGKFDETRKPKEVMDYRKVIDMLYGPAPERDYDKFTLEDIEDAVDDEATYEDYAEIEASLKEVNQVIEAMKRLGEQCGCSINAEAE